MTTPNPARERRVSRRFSILLSAALLAALVVAAGTIIFLSRDLPEKSGEALHYPATDFKFAFGSGTPTEDQMLVNEFANGYALLSSGPVSIQANNLRSLRYTWLPSKPSQETAFFWRRADDPQNVERTEITLSGTQLINLSAEPRWRGEITEIGFLVAGDNGVPVRIGEASLIPDNLNLRLQLTWRAWATFEGWGQQSINFLYGGDYRQVLALPLLVAAWLFFTLLFLLLFQRFSKELGPRQLLMISALLFLLAWVLLDLRWAANNVRQLQLSFGQTDEQQRLSSGLDGEIYLYVQRLKSEVLSTQNARILIIGDETANDYYLLRTKYHLLPHSANVAGHFAKELAPESLDFVIFFGHAANIMNVPGWNQTWQQSLTNVDSGTQGTVYRVNQ